MKVVVKQLYHYVYRITNRVKNKHYYGLRTSKINPKLDLGYKYFSSSSDQTFLKDQKENYKNYKYKIIKIFNNRKEALKLEIKLHQKFNVVFNKSFYNKSKQTSLKFDTTGLKYTNEQKNLIKERLKLKHPKGMLGKSHTEKIKNQISNKMKKIKLETISYPIYQYDLNGNYLRKFKYIGEVVDFFNVNSALANVIKAAKNEHFKYKDSMWRFKYKIKIKKYLKPKMKWYFSPKTKESIRININKINFKKDIPIGFVLGWGRYH